MKVTRLALISILVTGLCSICFGQVLGPSIQEVNFSYTTEFLTENNGPDAQSLAYNHTKYLFGVLHSPTLTEKYGLMAGLVGGIGSPRREMTIKIIKFEKLADNKILVKYQVWGKLILHKNVAKNVLKAGSIQIPAPADLSTIYDKNCTDGHYSNFGDYWYFWDPLTLSSCQYLSRPPYSNSIKVFISPAPRVNPDLTPRLDLLRGNNGNGKLLSIYVIHGFAASSKEIFDEGRNNFQELNNYLKKEGFKESVGRKTHNRPLYIYTKSITMPNGQEVDVEIRHLLVETGIGSHTVTFAKFFREAIENADIVIYGGHSGLGGNLDISSLEEKSGKFVFNQKKRQIYYFDSCASYSYYLGPFAAEKTKSKIDIITNGLSSYFATSQNVLEGLLDAVLSEKEEDPKWIDILKAMEAPLKGGSFLLNVGAV